MTISIRRTFFLFLSLLGVLVVGSPAQAQQKEEVNNGQDPTKPLTRFDFRYQYQNAGPHTHDNVHVITPRADKPFTLAPGWSFSARIDMPLFITDVLSKDNRNGNYEFGLGDSLLQGLLIHTITERLALATGAQFIFPTASQDEMGAGKYRIVPTFGARYSLPEITKGSWGALLLRYDVDYAGDHDRGHVSELQVAPIVNIALPNLWFVNFFPSSDIRYNFLKKGPGDSGR
jgi:hypothetical protein